MFKVMRAVGWTGAGLLVGLGLALYIGWVAWPVQVTDITPELLDPVHRQEYTIMVADAYAVDGNLRAARRRLERVGGEAEEQWLIEVMVDAILAGRDEETVILPLVALARDLGVSYPAMTPYLPQLEENTGKGAAPDDVSE
ncbi:MAG: hypothetical protein R3272_02715 [Candidatus Promineifilaceae bacterium]|nr:hypothetical protein [Candidatus Promineifilaceae bacterium]